jgi:hypothetical protein
MKESNLTHETFDHSMKGATLITQRFPRRLTDTLFTRTEGPKVLGGLGDDIIEQLEHDPTHEVRIDGNVKEDSRALMVGRSGFEEQVRWNG